MSDPQRYLLDERGDALLLAGPDHSLPIVDVEFVWRGGASADELIGEHRLLSRMMRRGPEGRTTKAFDEGLETLGGRLGASISRESVRFSGTVLSRNIVPFLREVFQMQRSPAFDPEDLELQRRQIEAELASVHDDDASLAYMAHRRLLFGQHPYAEPVGGTQRDLARVDPARLRALHQARLCRGNLLVGVSGDVDLDVFRAELGQLWGSLPAGERIRPETPVPTAPAGRRVQIVHKEERSQTMLVMGTLGLAMGDPKGAALVVADTAFGGLFTSRLTHEIRTVRGWSYSVGSEMSFARQRGAWRMSSHPAVADLEACANRQLELYEEWLAEGVADQELERAKRYLVGSRAFYEDTAAKRLSLAMEAAIFDRPEDAPRRFRERVLAVDAAAARAAVRDTLGPELAIVAVGDARELEPVLGRLPGVSSVEVVQVADVLRAG